MTARANGLAIDDRRVGFARGPRHRRGARRYQEVVPVEERLEISLHFSDRVERIQIVPRRMALSRCRHFGDRRGYLAFPIRMTRKQPRNPGLADDRPYLSERSSQPERRELLDIEAE